MFTPPVELHQSIQDIRYKVHEDIISVKAKYAIEPIDLESLNETAKKSSSACDQILLLLSSHDVNQPDSFSPAERLQLQVLSNRAIEYKEFLETLIQHIEY